MFKVIANGDNRLDIEMSEELDVASMKVALDELVRKSEHIVKARMLYVVRDVQLPTLGAIGSRSVVVGRIALRQRADMMTVRRVAPL